MVAGSRRLPVDPIAEAKRQWVAHGWESAASGMTAVAYFLVHAPQGFFPILNKGELAVLYCFVFLYLAAAGAGPWSLDAMRRK